MTSSRWQGAPIAPGSLAGLLSEFRGCFSAWTFPVFSALACGLVAQTRKRTVCGTLVGARLSRAWSHHRAHRFFSHARWSTEALSATLARLVVRLVVPAGEAVTVAVDDTLFHRRGPKVHAANWFHDGSAAGDKKIGYANNWVILAIVVRLAILDRPLALPVGFALIRKGSEEASRLEAACRLVGALAEALPGRAIHVVADSAYAGKALRRLSAEVTWTTRLRSNAALYQLAPTRTGRRGRPKTKGDKLPRLAELAKTATFSTASVSRYGLRSSAEVAVIACLWYGVLGPKQVQVILVRDKKTTSYDVALVSTDPSATPAAIIERYAARWSIEVAIEDAKQTVGVGQARNRLRLAVERTVPFGLIGLTRLYRILDKHQIPRRRQTAPRLGNRLRQRVLADYRAGMHVDDIARKHGIAAASVGSIALKAGLTRGTSSPPPSSSR